MGMGQCRDKDEMLVCCASKGQDDVPMFAFAFDTENDASSTLVRALAPTGRCRIEDRCCGARVDDELAMKTFDAFSAVSIGAGGYDCADRMLSDQDGITQSKRYFDPETAELKEIQASFGQSSNRVIPQNNVLWRFKSGATYLGQWRNNMRDGYGKQAWPDGATYEGTWRENLASGKGRFAHSDGDVYIGQWTDNMANGLGTYYHKASNANDSSTTYRGHWRNDLQQGCGTESWIEGAEFQGTFTNGRKSGWGCYRWPDGSEYQGSWADQVIHGPGTYFATDGRCFKGQWKQSVIHGYGSYTWPTGRSYRGQYVSDVKHGFGIFRWPDGHLYEGFWSEGKQSGMGRYTTKDGVSKIGRFLNGHRISAPDDNEEVDKACFRKVASARLMSPSRQTS